MILYEFILFNETFITYIYYNCTKKYEIFVETYYYVKTKINGFQIFIAFL